MKVLLAGASGAIGMPIARQLIAHDHEVLGLIRSHSGAGRLAALGARVVAADALDRDALLRAVEGLSADAVIHELTALRKPPLRHSGMTQTDRLRTEGSTNLLAAAEVLGAKRFVTQSIILGYGYSDHGDHLLTEEAPFGIPAGNKSDPHVAAMESAERQAFTAPEGIALRYGLLYGGDAEQMRALLARRALPVTRGGLLGWVHHEDAARATVAALEHGRAGEAYNIVDDRPASWQEVFIAMARAFGAPPPRRLPRWMLRIAAPFIASTIGSSMRVSNAKAKTELGWRLMFPTYREGVQAMASRAHTGAGVSSAHAGAEVSSAHAGADIPGGRSGK
jgi:nucleoside-diphosphate-sugar epimerase